ncbi:hypothetical protein [Metabacillus idriensis]|uniref:hypothetical protein n=1 Tax=Metabacillus idriensis TaxID=324768 RepID=UPI00163A2C96|nr:hypothetical protein [Metabacillus idriensis]QNG58310.1 hypothetical protein H4O14_10540 [Bacillus sp. PAMC26568]
MLIFSVIAFAALIISIVSTFFAIKGKHQLYWIAAIGIYIFSLIAGFSIGQITVGLTFVFLALAIGNSFNMIKNKLQFKACLGVGFLVGVLMVAFVDDYWLFFPITLLS